jgi:hypothetical protein
VITSPKGGFVAEKKFGSKKKKNGSFFEKVSKSSLIAKKDFVISQNEYFREIKTGDDLADVPERFHDNLKVEKVL